MLIIHDNTREAFKCGVIVAKPKTQLIRN